MITAVIITANEEEVLEDCLKSLSGFADEIIVVDSESTDKTVSIAKKYNARIFSEKFKSFSHQRDLGLKHAKYDFIYYIDADERLTPEFKKEALSLVNAYNPLSNTAGYYVFRKTFYLNKDWGLFDKVQRLFYREKLSGWHGVVHETPIVAGEFEVISSPILHFTHRNLEQMLEKTNKWSIYEAELRYTSQHPVITWWRFPRVMIPAFFKSYIGQKGYKNGTAGIIESIFQAFSIFVTYAKLWELQNKTK